MTITRSTITATFGLALMIQTCALAAQDASSPPPPAEQVETTSDGVVANTTTLEVTFAQIADPTGQILLVLFDSKEAYDSGAAPVRAISVPVTGETITAIIPDVPHGRYGFKIVHDLNGDGAMTTNPFGIPIEPFAFSNNAVGNMGPATWEAAAFDISGPSAQTITFR